MIPLAREFRPPTKNRTGHTCIPGPARLEKKNYSPVPATLLPHIADEPHMALDPHIAELPHMAL